VQTIEQLVLNIVAGAVADTGGGFWGLQEMGCNPPMDVE
jgi:hypothetical protein